MEFFTKNVKNESNLSSVPKSIEPSSYRRTICMIHVSKSFYLLILHQIAIFVLFLSPIVLHLFIVNIVKFNYARLFSFHFFSRRTSVRPSIHYSIEFIRLLNRARWRRAAIPRRRYGQSSILIIWGKGDFYGGNKFISVCLRYSYMVQSCFLKI